jgi:hypothetical protein
MCKVARVLDPADNGIWWFISSRFGVTADVSSALKWKQELISLWTESRNPKLIRFVWISYSRGTRPSFPDKESALSFLQQAVKHKVRNSFSALRRLIEEEMKDLDRAVSIYQSLTPFSQQATHRLSVLYSQGHGNEEEAFSLLRESLIRQQVNVFEEEMEMKGSGECWRD